MRFCTALAAFLVGCSSSNPSTLPDAAPADVDAGLQNISDRTFGAFEPWATPIDDYLVIGKKFQGTRFNASINELAPMDDRLFIGYGDADYNLGEKIPIEFRFFASPDDPMARALAVDGAGQGAPQKTPLQSGEEQIDRYRLLDGVLFQAGIDSIDPDELWTQNLGRAHADRHMTMPKPIAGNAYRLAEDTWKKFRSIRGGEHVHDLMSWNGAVYGVGSGADIRPEFESGQIFRYLWKSTDLGASFTTVQRVMHPNPGKGDIRWITLLPSKDALYLFGYQSDFAAMSAKISNSSYDGQAVTDLPMGHPLHDIFAHDTLVLPDGNAIVRGTDVAAQRYTAGLFANATFQKLTSLDGSRAVDVSLTSTGELLYLVTAGDDTSASLTSWDVRVLVAKPSSPDQTKEVLSFTTDVRPISIAYFKGHLFLGTNAGQVLRTP